MDDHDLTLTSADTNSRVYIGPNMRIYAENDPRFYGMHPFNVQTLYTDRLGSQTWQDSSEQPTRHQIQKLAKAVMESGRGHPDPLAPRYWYTLAGPFNGYRVLVRRTSWLSKLFGRPYEFVVERDRGTTSIPCWSDADIAPNPFARLAYLLKRELGSARKPG